MLIGYDASRARMGVRTGTEHYSARLLEALSGLAPAAQHRFTCYVNAPPGQTADALFGFPLTPNFRLRAIPLRRAWTHVRLSIEMVRHPPAVLFIPAHVVPPAHPAATVVTIHDLGYIPYPRAHTWASRLYLGLATRWSTRAARLVIAISQTTADDLHRYYRVPTEKIRVVRHGCDPMFEPITNGQELLNVRQTYDLPVQRPYILYVGTLQPRKNLGRLVEAFAAGLGAGRLGSPPPMLVLAGKKGWLYDELFATVRRLGLEAHVAFPGYVAQEDLPALISGAVLFAFPSLYEGFGLPALEAMACGTPLIAARASSLPEVVDDAGLLCDPHDTEEWVGALEAVLTDETLRTRLRGAGMARAARFTWHRAAAETLRVLVEAGPRVYQAGRG